MQSNYIRLSKHRKDAIATALHKTIESYSAKISPYQEQTHLLCLYYAMLGEKLLTIISRQVNNDKTISYQAMGGTFSLRISKNQQDNSRGINFGAEYPNFESGKFHLWIVGLVKNNQVIHPYEFIDFTSKYYSKNALEQHGYIWERDDIFDYLWLDETQVEDYGIRFIDYEFITNKAILAWSNIEFREEMFQQAVKNYKEIIDLIPEKER
jgi:hypothetical protein